MVYEQKGGDCYQPYIEDEGCVKAKFAVFAEEGAHVGVLLQSCQIEAVGYYEQDACSDQQPFAPEQS